MDFDREQLQKTLDIARMAIDKREFIPILSHFCFSGKFVTTYNDMIGIQAACRTNFVCALQADTLLRLVNSVGAETISIGCSETTAYFKAGATRKGVRARLPFMQEEDFFFKWPNMKRLQTVPLASEIAEKFFRGIELCLSSVGESQPTQMGVTLHETGNYLRLYSTNNKSLSRFTMKPALGLFENDILPTSFCQAVIKGSQVYGNEEVKISKGKEFVVVSFGDKCKMYAKLISNKDPLDFEKVIKQHLPKDYKKAKQKWTPDLLEGFQRSLIILGSELTRNVVVSTSQKVVSIEARSASGKLKSSATLSKTIKCKDKFQIDADLALKALDNTEHICFANRSVVFSKGTYMHFVSTVSVYSDDDIPF